MYKISCSLHQYTKRGNEKKTKVLFHRKPDVSMRALDHADL